MGVELAKAGDTGLVLACSALPPARQQRGPQCTGRRALGHFLPPALLDSQLATLEQLEPDEPGTAVDIAAPMDQLVQSGPQAGSLNPQDAGIAKHKAFSIAADIDAYFCGPQPLAPRKQ